MQCEWAVLLMVCIVKNASMEKYMLENNNCGFVTCSSSSSGKSVRSPMWANANLFQGNFLQELLLLHKAVKNKGSIALDSAWRLC